MSPTRTNDDLERLLRATLTTRSRTVDYGPSWEPLADRSRRRWRPSRPQVVVALAAAAAVVLGLAATIVVLHLRSDRGTPAATTPARAFTSFEVPGYTVTSRGTQSGGSRDVVVRTPGGEAAGNVDVTVYSPHEYVFNRLQDQKRVQVSGHRGYSGWAGSEEYHGHMRPLHDVIWQFAPDQWAVAQQMGNLRVVPRMVAILRVARAARPTQHLALTTPFRLGALPAGYTFDQLEAQPSGVIFLFLDASGQRRIRLTYTPAGTPQDGGPVTVRHAGAVVSIVAFPWAGKTTPADKAVARQAAHHIVWGTTELSRIVP